MLFELCTRARARFAWVVSLTLTAAGCGAAEMESQSSGATATAAGSSSTSVMTAAGAKAPAATATGAAGAKPATAAGGAGATATAAASGGAGAPAMAAASGGVGAPAMAAAGMSGSAGGSAAAGGPTFTRVYDALFSNSAAAGCYGCHSGMSNPALNGNFSMVIDKAAAYKGLVGAMSSPEGMCKDMTRVTASDPMKSLLYLKISGSPPCGMEMPPGGTLPADVVSLVKDWIMAGAKDD